MTGQPQLLKLVDLALCNSEVGAVNFNHLRTLLLAIIKSNDTANVKQDQNQQHSDIFSLQSEGLDQDEPGSNIEAQEENVESGRIPGESDSGINITKDNNNNNQNRNVLDNRNIQAGSNNQDLLNQINSLVSSQKKLEKRINTLENDLNSCEKFASNESILKSVSENVDNVKSERSSGKKRASSADILGPAWQNMKTKKRLESAEEAIDKLFSLLNELLAKQDESESDEQNTEDVNKNLSDLTKSNEAEHETFRNKQNDLENKYDQTLEDLKRIEEDIKNIQASVHENKDVSENNKIELTDMRNELNNIKNYSQEEIEKKDTVDAGDSKKKDTVDAGDSKNFENEKNKVEAENAASIADIVRQIQDLSDSLTKKVDLSQMEEFKDKIVSLDEKLHNSIVEINQELDKLKENISNMDNEEIRNVMNSMNDLKEMAEQIEELRKLKDLKDLADNVDNLKDIKSELDNLKLKDDQFDQFSKMLEEFTNKQNSLEEELRTIKDETTNDQNETKSKEDQSNSESSEDQFKHLKQMQDNLASMLNNLMEEQKNSKLDNSVIDASVVAAVQHLAQQNRQQIATVQADLNILKKLQTGIHHQEDVEPRTTSNGGDVVDSAKYDKLHTHLSTLQEEQVRLAGQLANMLDDTKDEFNRKQYHIDALYDYIDKLQNNKADKEDITSSMNVKADKQALDSKVNMSTFDERYQMLEQALQDALDRLDQFVEKETTLSNALNKLHTDLDSKMDSDAEKKLKKFMEDRLKEIQKSRNNLQEVEDGDGIKDFRNAAGLRRPMPLMYNCISCDRPVDITLRGVMGSVPQNFPAKKTMGPYTSFELDNLRNNNNNKKPSFEKFNGGRSCGGQHTTANTNTLRSQKNHQYSDDYVDAYERNIEQADLSVIDCVVGKDGQIYRGRFKPNQYPAIPKRAVGPNGRTKHHYKHRYVHSAIVPAPAKDVDLYLSSKNEARASSADLPEKQLYQNGGGMRNSPPPPPFITNGSREMSRSQNGSPVPTGIGREKQRSASPLVEKQQRNGSPISLPPISRDGSLIGEEITKPTSS